MTGSSPSNSPAETGEAPVVWAPPPRRRRRLVLASVLLSLAAAVAAVVLVTAIGSESSSASKPSDAVSTSLARVERTTLESRTQASGTIGYADPATLAGLGMGSVFTWLPEPGAVIRRGQRLYSVDGSPTRLMYGALPAWREFRPGMSDGRDVEQLNANLRALGYGDAPSGDGFTDGTRQAIEELQADHGLSETGSLPLGSVVFRPGPARISSVAQSLGAPFQPGAPVLDVTSTRHTVDVQLDPSQQANVKVGDKVRITLPDNTTTTGVISRVGTVSATGSSSSSTASDQAAAPMLNLEVRLLDQRAARRLDQAPVQVSITTAKVKDVLVVPITALLAQSGGRYAVEVADGEQERRLVPVEVGLFDDANGLVQVEGRGLRAGQRVVVPAL
jgi:peptidoglycan hydrolase-like protein with peptidoglycan-binding domain